MMFDFNRAIRRIAPLSVTTLVAISHASAQVTIAVDANANRKAINPNIYGVAAASATDIATLNATLNRWGGNPASRYNWQVNTFNRGNDFFYESIQDGSAVAGASGDTFVSDTKNNGAQPLMTVPMIGYVGTVNADGSRKWSFSVAKYGAQTFADGDAGNGVSTASGNPFITGNNPLDANVANSTAFELTWLQHLKTTFGAVSAGGVKYYLMDNESGLWHATHRDVHPVGATMSEVLGDITSYAAMVKGNDANALIVAPDEWGWEGYLESGNDLQTGNGSDRAAHGGMDYMPWLLQNLKSYDTAHGTKSIDVFSLHYYPQQGEYSSDDSAATQAIRNRSTRSLWDPTYTDTSWIGSVVQLIPRMKSWVSTYYPGLPTAITEYNWGDEANMNGATALADVWGIFGREGLDMATYWTFPPSGTPTYAAMKLYRNYDGAKSTFGDTSVSCTVPNADQQSAFAAQRGSDSALTVMVINKITSATPATINLANFTAAATAQRWQIAPSAPTTITRLSDITVSANSISDTSPAQSITLYVIRANNSAPFAPTALTANFGNAQAALSWSASSGATSYNALRSTVSGSGYASVATGIGTTSYTNTGLTNGTTYYFVVTATNSFGTSGNSNQVSVTPTASIPPAPTGLTGIPGNAQALLNWTASTGAASYNVLRSTVNGSGYATVVTGLTVTTYTDNAVVNGTTYYYVVTAANLNGTSGNSNQASVTPSGAPVASFKADAITGLSNGAAVTTWTDTAGAHNATVPGGSNAPLYITGAMNAKPVVRFANASSQMLSFSRPVQDDFTITCVYRSTQGLTTTTSFYNGAGLVQGEVSGVANDFGLSLNANGALLTGTGNPDTNCPSGNGFNDGNPHVVTFQRVKSSGALSVFVDGNLGGTATGATQSLTSPTTLGMGGTIGNLNYLTGDIAEIEIYNYVLSTTDRQTLENGLKTKWGIGGTLPAAPTGLTATAGNTQVALSWTASSGATTYNVLRSTVSGSGYASAATGIVPTSYTNTGLTNGTTYYFVVTATNAAGTSGNSNQASATPTPSIPSAPTGLTAAPGNAQVALSWTASSGATSYNVLRSTISGSGYTSVATGIVPVTYTNTGLTNGTTYYFVVTATNASGTSGNSNQASATPTSTPGSIISVDFVGGISGSPLPMASTESAGVVAAVNWNDIVPASGNGTALNFNTGSASGATLAWTATGVWGTGITDTPGNNRMMAGYLDNATGTNSTLTVSGLPSSMTTSGYDVYVYSDVSGGLQTDNYTIGGTTITVAHAFNVNFAGTFIQANNSDGNYVEFTNLNSASFTLTAAAASGSTRAPINGIQIVAHSGGGAPAAPTGLTATPGNAQVALAWTASTGATSYNVSRSTVSGSGYVSVATGIAVTNYTNTGLTNGTTYYFVVSATNSAGTSANSAQASATPGAAPPAPTGLTATPGNAQVALAWTASSGATSYNALRSTINGSGYASVATGIAVTNYTNTGLINGTTYYFVTTATNAVGTSGNSNQASATPVGPPAAPTGLTATAGNAQVALSWTASSGATSYNVLRSTVNGSGYASVATGIVPVTYTNTGLTNGTVYYFVVTATNTGGTSGNSNQASAKPLPTAPTAPTGLTATKSNAQVVLIWTASSGATSYNVLRSTVSGSGYASVATGIAPTTYTNTGLTNGTTYYFVVTATNTGGTSGNSNQASATPSVSIISVDFVGGYSGSPLAMGSAESAGVVAATNWNNIVPASGSGVALNYSTGSGSGASLAWSASGVWGTGITDTPGNNRMMAGYLDNATGVNTTVTVSSLPSAMTTSGYDVYVYTDVVGGLQTDNYTIGGTTITAIHPFNVNFSGTFIQANNSNGNYVKFTSLSGASFTITAAAASGSTRAPINGIQIVGH